MAYDFSSFKKGLQESEEWLVSEYQGIRTGRATPAILDNISIEVYGARTPLKHVAAVSTEDAKTIRVAPWDKGQVKAIEKAIMEADLGLSTSSDAQGVRVIFPALTSERRASLVKITKEKLEQGRVRVRSDRDEAWKDIQSKEKDGDITEDDKFRLKDEMQKMVDAMIGKMEEHAAKKEKEIAE